MANVLFKRGLSTALPTQAQDGVFYLTTDTNRLYVGNGSTLAELNRYVKVVKAEADLNNLQANLNDFVYIDDGNILAVRVADGWRQINPDSDTNDDTQVTAITFNPAEQYKDETTGNLVIPFKIKQTQNNLATEGSTELQAIDGKIEIDKNAFATMTVEVAVSVNSTVENGTATIKTSGIGSAGNGINITGQDAISVSGTPDNIIINGHNTTYELSSKAQSTTITLSEVDGEAKTEVALKAGNQVVLNGSVANEITVGHSEISNADVPSSATSKPVNFGSEFNVISSITLDNGHVTGYTKDNITLPAESTHNFDNFKANNDGTVQFDFTSSNTEQTVTAKSTASLYYKYGENNDTASTIYNQGNLYNYVDAHIKTILSGVNAMSYKGTVGSNGTITSLPTSGDGALAIGDTYMVAEDGTYASKEATAGDLFIATAESEIDGVIVGAVTWTHVPSGNEVDTQYRYGTKASSEKGISVIKSSTDEAEQIINFVPGQNNGDILISSTESIVGDTGVNGEVKISHKDYNDTKSGTLTATSGNALTPKANESFTILSAIETSNGHVTGFTTQSVTLPTDNNTIYDFAASQVTANASSKVALSGNDDTKDIVYFDAEQTTNDSINVNTTENHIKYAHKTYDYVAPIDVTLDKTLTYGESIKVVSGVTQSNGHITGLTTTQLTLPASDNVTYELKGSVATAATVGNKKGLVIKDTLTGSNDQKTGSNIAIVSESLALTSETAQTGEDGRYSIEIQWGTF